MRAVCSPIEDGIARKANGSQRRVGSTQFNSQADANHPTPGLNSRPGHIKLAFNGMLKRLRKDLMDEGKALLWGLNKMGLDTLR